MRELRVRQGAKPVLALKELKRKRIARLQEAGAKAFESVRDSCSSAQQEVAKALAQGRVILLHEVGSPTSQRAAV